MIHKLLISELGKISDFPFNIECGTIFSDYPVHTHDFSEIFIILSGSANHSIGNAHYPVLPGDIYVINGDIPHGFNRVNALELCNIGYRPDIFFADTTELKKLAGFQALFLLEPYYRAEKNYKSRLRLEPSKVEAAKDFIQTLLWGYWQKTPGCEISIKSYLTAFAVFLSREYEYRNAGGNEILGLAKVLAYMENNYLSAIKLEELGYQANLSPRHLCRLFRAIYRNSPIHYILQLRIKHACTLLASGSLNISQVSQQSGFTDSNYFAREFKRQMGVSPSEYRKRARSQFLFE